MCKTDNDYSPANTDMTGPFTIIQNLTLFTIEKKTWISVSPAIGFQHETQVFCFNCTLYYWGSQYNINWKATLFLHFTDMKIPLRSWKQIWKIKFPLLYQRRKAAKRATYFPTEKGKQKIKVEECCFFSVQLSVQHSLNVQNIKMPVVYSPHLYPSHWLKAIESEKWSKIGDSRERNKNNFFISFIIYV